MGPGNCGRARDVRSAPRPLPPSVLPLRPWPLPVCTPLYGRAEPRFACRYTLCVGDLRVAAELHAKHMELLDAWISTTDTISITLACMYMSCGVFPFETDLRWQVVDTASCRLACWAGMFAHAAADDDADCDTGGVRQAAVKRRVDRKLVELMDLPEGTPINLETCDTGCRNTSARTSAAEIVHLLHPDRALVVTNIHPGYAYRVCLLYPCEQAGMFVTTNAALG